MASELKEKTIKGVSWGFADNLMNTGIMAVVNIILARILTDSDFGIVGLTAIFITLATSMVDSGFSGALTRKQTVSEKDFNTVFHFNMAVSLVLYTLLFFLAPVLADFFAQPILIPVVRVLGLSLLVTAASIVQKVILVRRIDFRTQAIISAISSVTSGITGIVLALLGYGVWSLVVLQLMRLVMTTVLLWAFAGWTPSLLFSKDSFKEMFSFGGRLLLTSIISIISNEIYSIIIGKVYTPGLLGQYSRADKFKSMVTSNVSIVMQRVSYPVLASIQDERERQRRIYRKVLKTTVLISFTSVLGLMAVAESFTIVLVGEQWLPAIPFLRILCLSGIFLPLLVCSANVINADGRSDITLKLEIVKTLLSVIPIMLGIFISIEALLWGMVGTSSIMFLIYAANVSKVTGYRVSAQLRDIFPTLAISAVMAGLVHLLSLLEMPQFPTLLLQVAAGVAIVVFSYEVVYRCEEYDEIKGELLRLMKKTFTRRKK